MNIKNQVLNIITTILLLIGSAITLYVALMVVKTEKNLFIIGIRNIQYEEPEEIENNMREYVSNYSDLQRIQRSDNIVIRVYSNMKVGLRVLILIFITSIALSIPYIWYDAIKEVVVEYLKRRKKVKNKHCSRREST